MADISAPAPVARRPSGLRRTLRKLPPTAIVGAAILLFWIFTVLTIQFWPLADPLANIMYNAELALLLSGAAYLLKIYDGRTLTGVQLLNPTTVTWDYKDGENRYTQKIGD